MPKREWERRWRSVLKKLYKRRRARSYIKISRAPKLLLIVDEHRKDTKIIITSIKIFRNFNIKKNFCYSCIFSTSFSNIYTSILGIVKSSSPARSGISLTPLFCKNYGLIQHKSHSFLSPSSPIHKERELGTSVTCTLIYRHFLIDSCRQSIVDLWSSLRRVRHQKGLRRKARYS